MEDTALGATSRGDEMGAESIECVEKDAALGGSTGNDGGDNLSCGESKAERESLAERCAEGTTGEKCQMGEAPTREAPTGGPPAGEAPMEEASVGVSPTGEGSLERICQYSERDKSEVGGALEGEKSHVRGSESTMESLPGISYVKAQAGDQTNDDDDKAKKREPGQVSANNGEPGQVSTNNGEPGQVSTNNGEPGQVSKNNGEPNQVNTNENDKRESWHLDSGEKPNCSFAKQPNSRTKREDIKEQSNKEDTNGNVRNYYSDNCISKDDYQNSSSHLSSSVEDEDSEEMSSNEGYSDRSEDSGDGRSSSVLSEDYDEEEEEDDDEEDDEDDEDYEDGKDEDGNCANGNGADGQNTEEMKSQGNELFKKGDYKQAIFYYNKALKKCKEKSTKSILYSNRAACYSHLGNWNQVVEDCNKSINYNESFVKSYIRRSNAYEQLEKYNDASNDLNKAISLDSSLLANYEMKQKKLKYLAEQQLNKEKEEMVGKLKDFGNLLLGKVGLSLDNFEVQKNPNNDGSFNIQFKQNK
ncbi:TPR Domain containing protein [Plasmodium cynomolgi strain B]|uniref:TPR Domain containing protein n=1 Tax=Plasmodium cynomolgi (strain B) TaxID=1120755 RepID=K6VIM8_PLACD|nr:TPR Domain containing protein [Plasmodium cynomolgi strain B]GAB69237.1 TPR Domain containing protein [Plasmodium cynomolgi strain B]